jgi:hypothetical protein
MSARLPVIVLAAALAAACGGDNSTATSPTTTTTTTSTSVTYTGTLDAGASRFYSFTNSAAGSVTAFLASVTAADNNRAPLTVPIELGIGVPTGTGCATTNTQVVTPGLVSQMNVSLAAGVFCLRVADAGEITSPITFAVRFTHP